MIMSDKYESWLAELKREIETEGAHVTAIDAAVSELLAAGDERLVGDLLLLLSDSAMHDEGMFSLIHAAESFDDSAYVRALLSVFLPLMKSAPRWASIVLKRLLNSDAARSELVRQLHAAPTHVKGAMREMCARVGGVVPSF